MASSSELTARLEALDKALATGALTVRHGDTETTYRSLEEMMKIRAGLNDQIDALGNTPRRRARYFYQTDKGL